MPEYKKDPDLIGVHTHQDKTKKAFSVKIVVPKQHFTEDAILKTAIPQLSQILQQLPIEDANQIGSESGFI